ncbi:helix-turn-helix domain-containing protein [Eisenbergiella tayi]|uniref:helix-turn-helix domain-containing protein n=1 Tax=Eisenbergiella tayi TaxID=1432052 RepID=UPI003A7F4D33
MPAGAVRPGCGRLSAENRQPAPSGRSGTRCLQRPRCGGRGRQPQAGQAPKKPGTGPLTETELRAARLIAKGKYNKEIAVELGITYGRTRNLVSAVYRKLGAVDRVDLIAKLEKG